MLGDEAWNTVSILVHLKDIQCFVQDTSSPTLTWTLCCAQEHNHAGTDFHILMAVNDHVVY